jgi:hypothetical protein
MKVKITVGILLSAAVALLIVFCAKPLDPRTVSDNAKLDKDHSLKSLTGTLNANQSYACTLHVALPELVDSVNVLLDSGSAASTIFVKKPLSSSDTIILFTVTVGSSAQEKVMAFLFRANAGVDTLIVSITVALPKIPPTIKPDSLVYHTYLRNKVDVHFAITDPDSDIRSCQVWVDSVTGTSTGFPLSGSNRGSTSITDSITSTKFDTIVVFAQAIDSIGNFSAMAQCTVFVLDTVKPVLSLLHITPSFGDTSVKNLPCTLSVLVKDDSPIDSVKYQNQLMSMNGDTAWVLIASLDSGKVRYPVVAWDRARNRDSLSVPINYIGTIKYKLALKTGITQTVAEDVPFKSISLDSCIASINPDPSLSGIGKWRDSLVWTITDGDTSARSIKDSFDLKNRRVFFAVGDSEWNGTETFTLLANWPGTTMAAGSITLTVTPVNDPPRLLWKSSCMKTPYDSLLIDANKCATDPDNTVSSLTWTDTAKGTYFMLLRQSGLRTAKVAVVNPIEIIPRLWNGTWKLVPKPGIKFATILGRDWTGIDTIRVGVSDGQHTDSGKVIITVPCSAIKIP